MIFPFIRTKILSTLAQLAHEELFKIMNFSFKLSQTTVLTQDNTRPFLLPHEFVQPIEIPILEFIHNTKFNHKLYNLIQNTPYEFAVGTEELTTIKALQLLWPLLQTKNIIRILAKLLTTSDLIHDIFPHGFFPDD